MTITSFQDGFYVSPGHENLVAFTPEVANTTETALKMTQEDRDCYQDSVRKLFIWLMYNTLLFLVLQEFGFPNLVWKDGFKYSMKNCLYQSVLSHIMTNCSCIPLFGSNHMYLEKEEDKSIPFCQGLKLACSQYWMYLFGSENNPDLSRAWNNESQYLPCRQVVTDRLQI